MARETVTDLAYDDFTYTGEAEDGVPNGMGKCVFESGNTYEGMFADGQPNGKGIKRFTKGSVYEGFLSAANGPAKDSCALRTETAMREIS